MHNIWMTFANLHYCILVKNKKINAQEKPSKISSGVLSAFTDFFLNSGRKFNTSFSNNFSHITFRIQSSPSVSKNVLRNSCRVSYRNSTMNFSFGFLYKFHMKFLKRFFLEPVHGILHALLQSFLKKKQFQRKFLHSFKRNTSRDFCRSFFIDSSRDFSEKPLVIYSPSFLHVLLGTILRAKIPAGTIPQNFYRNFSRNSLRKYSDFFAPEILSGTPSGKKPHILLFRTSPDLLKILQFLQRFWRTFLLRFPNA